ncbi:MAG: hypothetical protein DDG60_03260 [Anaerolineae bacterium]|nr:MAG: hypothetical protein DDG60_03260 [Anaerolineae bacterium]
MESLRQASSGLLFGLVCLAIVIGGFALSMAEGGMGVSIPSATFLPSPLTTQVAAISPTLLPQTSTLSSTPIATVTLTFTPPPPPTNCPPPAGWIAVVVQINDTLPDLARAYRTSSEAIRQANCLVSDQLVPGSFLYLPPLPTITPIPCGAPPGWINYLVQPGDTLFSISQKFRVSVTELQRANCLGSSTFIQAGKVLKVPNVPTSTPSHSPTPSATFIVIREETSTPTETVTSPPSETPSETPGVPSNTPPPTATLTPTATP